MSRTGLGAAVALTLMIAAGIAVAAESKPPQPTIEFPVAIRRIDRVHIAPGGASVALVGPQAVGVHAIEDGRSEARVSKVVPFEVAGRKQRRRIKSRFEGYAGKASTTFFFSVEPGIVRVVDVRDGTAQPLESTEYRTLRSGTDLPARLVQVIASPVRDVFVASRDGARPVLLSRGQDPAGVAFGPERALQGIAYTRRGDRILWLVRGERVAGTPMPVRLALTDAGGAARWTGDTPIGVVGDASTLGPVPCAVDEHGSVALIHYGGALQRWDMRRGRREWSIVPGEPLRPGGIAVSAAAGVIALAGRRAVELLDLKDGKPRGSLPVGPGGPPGAVAFTPDGRQLVVATTGSTVQIWDAAKL